MSKHTPGPWTINELGHIYAGNSRVCDMSRFPTDYHPTHDGEHNANAKLIAAAPDLLEVAKSLAALDSARGDISDHVFDKLRDYATQAVTKATA